MPPQPNPRPQFSRGGVFVPGRAGPSPEEMMEAQMRTMRINIAAETMARLVAADVFSPKEDYKPQPDNPLTQWARLAVGAADALLQELSRGPYALPIDWKEASGA